MTGVHRDTIMRLGIRVGQGCAGLLDAKMHSLSCKQLQFDEIWGFVPIKEVFQGKTVWEGIVEVFELKNHPKAEKVYAWSYETDNPKKARHVTVLHVGPITSPLLAVRAAIVQEFRQNAATSEEN
jgi:hypothetical protein